jgi:hypothetical protein
MQHLHRYVRQYLMTAVDVKPDTPPLFWSTLGQRSRGLVQWPVESKNV